MAASQPRVGFVVWNEFQCFHVRPILERFPEAVLFVEDRPGLTRHFPAVVARGLPNRLEHVRAGQGRRIDDLVDVLVVQSKTALREELRHARVAALQYSLSKEWHQYGPWMTGSDLVLCFGDYSKERIRSDAPVVPVGNPRLEDFHAGRLDPARLARLRASLDPSKPTMMIAPSWNDRAAIVALHKGVRALEKRFNVLFAPHHNTWMVTTAVQSWIQRHTTGWDRYLYHLAVSQVLVSDTSGALFDAIDVGCRPLIADLDGRAIAASAGRPSIEFDRRAEIGPVAATLDEIAGRAQDLLAGRLDFSAANERLRRECFAPPGAAADRVMDAIRSHIRI